MYPKWKVLVRDLRMHAAPRRLTAMLSILTAFTLLFSFAASAQPVLAVDVYPPADAPTRPTVNGLYWGDRDFEIYGPAYATGLYSDTKLYRFVDPPGPGRRMFVAMVVDGNLNDNVFDEDKDYSDYMKSAGWPKYRSAAALMNSEFAEFTVDICGDGKKTWEQGYARQENAVGNLVALSQSVLGEREWVSDPRLDSSKGAPPAEYGYESSTSMVWNLNNYADRYGDLTTQLFDMGVNCTTSPCNIDFWKSPFVLGAGNTVTTTGGWPETITTTTPISFSIPYQWEWAMVYEWSVLVPEGADCTPDEMLITTGSVHHSPSKTGISDDPTPVTLTALAASESTALLPIAGLLVGVGAVIVASRRRRRRDQ